jgi:hypothetical protein
MTTPPNEVIEEITTAHDGLDGAVLGLHRPSPTAEAWAAVVAARWRLVRAYTDTLTEHGDTLPTWLYRLFCDAADGQRALAREAEQLTQPTPPDTGDDQNVQDALDEDEDFEATTDE